MTYHDGTNSNRHVSYERLNNHLRKVTLRYTLVFDRPESGLRTWCCVYEVDHLEGVYDPLHSLAYLRKRPCTVARREAVNSMISREFFGFLVWRDNCNEWSWNC